jgi:A/G-specific adenine glycosylase
MPAEEKILCSLPGIGSYTAAALRVFVFDLPAVVIETNIRAVFIEEFFRNATKVSDHELHPLVAKACDVRSPREWYYALMDLGASLKRTNPRLTGKSRAYLRQSRFKGSVRQVRGAIVREMVRGEGGPRRIDRLFDAARTDIGELERERFERALMSLVKDEFVLVAGGEVILCGDR